MFKKSLFSIIFIASVLFQGCDDKKTTTIEKANSMITTNEFVLTSTTGKQFIIKKSKVAVERLIKKSNGKTEFICDNCIDKTIEEIEKDNK